MSVEELVERLEAIQNKPSKNLVEMSEYIEATPSLLKIIKCYREALEEIRKGSPQRTLETGVVEITYECELANGALTKADKIAGGE